MTGLPDNEPGRRDAAFECALQAWELLSEYTDEARERVLAIREKVFPAARTNAPATDRHQAKRTGGPGRVPIWLW